MRYLLSVLGLSVALMGMNPVIADETTDAMIDEIVRLSGTHDRLLAAAILSTRNSVLGSPEAQAMPQQALRIVSEEIVAEVRRIFEDPAMWTGARGVYSERFNTEELTELRDFFRSDVGRKHASMSSEIDRAVLSSMQPVFAGYDIGPSIMQRSVPRLLEAGLITEVQADLMLAGVED
jgi:hypothetical protein